MTNRSAWVALKIDLSPIRHLKMNADKIRNRDNIEWILMGLHREPERVVRTKDLSLISSTADCCGSRVAEQPMFK